MTYSNAQELHQESNDTPAPGLWSDSRQGSGVMPIAGASRSGSPGTWRWPDDAPPACRIPASPTEGDDILIGTFGPDTIHGLAGNDRIWGLAGNDTLLGDAGDDVLYGGPGEDNLDGGDGNDYLIIGPGADRLTGGPGDDSFVASPFSVGHVTITDWGIGHDSIDLHALLQARHLNASQVSFDTTTQPGDTIITVTGTGFSLTVPDTGLNNFDTTDLQQSGIIHAASSGPVLLDEVPSFQWYHGCGPTAAASVLGYYSYCVKNCKKINIINGLWERIVRKKTP
jgi:Ca2+-binding RTX toxin-like protein